MFPLDVLLYDSWVQVFEILKYCWRLNYSRKTMIIKLVRTDSTDSCKIPLVIGEHVIGRGKLLACDDKRISRHHGKLEVGDATLSLKALHQNPCFFTNKGSTEVVILRQGDSKALSNGDRFGLLPDSFWYEVLFCSDLEAPNCDSEKNTEEYCVENNESCSLKERTESPSLLGSENNESTYVSHSVSASENLSHSVNNKESKPLNNHETGNRRQSSNPDEPDNNVEDLNVPDEPDNHNESDNHNEKDNQNEPEHHGETDKPHKPDNHNESHDHIETDNENEPQHGGEKDKPHEPDNPNEFDINDEPIIKTEPNDASPNKESDDLNQQSTQVENTSTKRSHSPDNVDVKKIKTEVKNEPEDVKAGPSLNLGQVPAANDGAPNANNCAPKANNCAPNINDARNYNPPRERCMYGASCYRRRPEHLSKYSHPRDPDWGPGARGVCPYGAACNKTDPRHWRDHDHPPGKLPPPRPGMQVVERHGNVFFINARSVNFYDDHFQVEDSDGDSVDFDYEF